MLPIPIVDTQSRSRKRPSEAARSALDSVASRPPDEPTDYIDESEPARTRQYLLLYLLLSLLLADPPDAVTLSHIARIRRDGTALRLAHAPLAEAARKVRAKSVDREFFDLFAGMGRQEFVPYGSYHLTGFLNEHPLARLRDDLRAHGEPNALADGGGGSRCHSLPPWPCRSVFPQPLAPWAERFFAELTCAEATGFSRHPAKVESLFIQIEKDAFATS
jgi:TorA maturation chaperone TorD